jgi:multidrug efflux system outer membrane protein
MAPWHEFYTDPRLQQVISMALTNNRDLKIAMLNVQRTRGMYGIQRSTLWPTINANGSQSRERLPADLSKTGARSTQARYDANFGVASWEIDFFGRIASLKDEALHTYLASEQARHNAQILLVSSVANAYLAMAADNESLTLASDTLASQEKTYRLIQRRHELQLASDIDVKQAQAQVEQARVSAINYTQRVEEDKNALQLLAGTRVPEDLLPKGLNTVKTPADIAPGLSSEVLLKRPDVCQAEFELKAANADIGAARAAFFPRISLTAAVGTASSDLSGLFKSGSGTWSYAPQIVMPIFDARTWSAHRVAKVQRELAVAEYERAIQRAFRDVADAMAVHATVDQEVAAQQTLVQAVNETFHMSTTCYEQGIANYLNVLDAQRSLYAAQQGMVLLKLARMSNQVQLYAALGGGWDTAVEPPAKQTTMK